MINPIHILNRDIPEIWAKIVERRPPRAESAKGVALARLPIIKDCVRNAIIEGAGEGSRNQIGHIIASELRGLGFSENQAKAILSSMWNPRNKPPLSEGEIGAFVDSAFGKREYTYGCRKDSPLRQHLRCKREDGCFYIKIPKTLYGSHQNASIR